MLLLFEAVRAISVQIAGPRIKEQF